MRELIDTENEFNNIYLEKFKNRGIRFTLDILENGRTREGRDKLFQVAGIPKSFILYFVNLADMSRLPYSNRKTVKHLLAGGYDSVAKIAQTDPEIIIEDMRSYFERIGVKLTGFIDLKGIAQWARTIPVVVEY